MCYICEQRARCCVCVWIEKNGLVLVVISEKVKGIKWFCVCASVQERWPAYCCPRVAFSAGHLRSLPFRVASFSSQNRGFLFQNWARALLARVHSRSRDRSVSELLSGVCCRVCRKSEFVLLKRRLNCNTNGEGACVFHFVKSNVIIGQMN